MKITYISNSSTPSHVPSSLQIVKTCEYLSKNNHQVTLIVPDTPKSAEKINSFYNVKHNFTTLRISMFKKNPRGFNYYFFSTISVFKSLFTCDLVITRNFFVIFLCTIFFKKCILEIHHDISTESRIVNFIFNYFNILKSNRIKKIIAISESIKKHYIKKFKLNSKKIYVLPSGTALKLNYVYPKNKKKKLNIGYFGSINYSKGIGTILKLACMDKKNDYFIYGGMKNQILDIKRKFHFNNLKISSHQNYKELPKILSKMDILLMPYTHTVTAAGNVSDITKFTSPLKLFDYMAAGKLIMCSDIPVLKEVIKNKNNCIIVQNFLNPNNWLMEINKIKNNYHLRSIISKNSYNEVRKYHHNNRVKKYFENI